MSPSPDKRLAIQRYRELAPGYDASAQFTMPLRERTIDLLGLLPGETVLDVGAGTGLSYELLRRGVGAAGHVLGCEQSSEMFEQAQTRVASEGWANVWHCQSSAEDVVLPRTADAVLFNYVHDVIRSPAAITNILCQVRPGGRIALAGMKFFPWWTGPLNLLAWWKNRPYNNRPAEMWRPWDLMQAHCTGFEIQSTQCGMGYIARGVLRQPPD